LGELIVRAFLAACLAIIVLGAGAYFGLNTIQKPSGIAYATDGVRIDPQWSWRSAAPQAGAGTQGASEGCGVRTAWQWIFVDFGIPHGESRVCSASQ
jgi:hypothetical protein